MLARVTAVLLLLGAAVPWPSHAQDGAPAADATLAFDVASVKPNKTGDARVSVANEPNGRFTMTNVPAQLMLVIAYQLQPYQIIGAPSWLDSDRFDLVAKAPESRPAPAGGGNTGPGPLQFMLRNMLAERFKLKAHTDTRDLPIYALVLARGDGKLGPKLQPSSVECGAPGRGQGPGAGAARGRGPAPQSGAQWNDNLPACSIFASAASVGGQGLPLSQLATNLSQRVGRTVVDRTGLSGRYDFLLEYTPEPPAGASPGSGAGSDPDRPSIYAALQEQLGLKLDAQRGAVDVLVIDGIQHPTED
jgi:uncharacterized protein (TIGR03435 family)